MTKFFLVPGAVPDGVGGGDGDGDRKEEEDEEDGVRRRGEAPANPISCTNSVGFRSWGDVNAVGTPTPAGRAVGAGWGLVPTPAGDSVAQNSAIWAK